MSLRWLLPASSAPTPSKHSNTAAKLHHQWASRSCNKTQLAIQHSISNFAIPTGWQ